MSEILLVVDMQNGFMSEKCRHIIPNIIKLIERFLVAGKVVEFTRFINTADSNYVKLIQWSCPIVVNFNGQTVTSDAGLTLIAELDRKRKITSCLAQCFKDYRDVNRIDHSVENLIAQRIYGLIMGYEDLNDHEELRHDPMFVLALGKIIGSEKEQPVLARNCTLNRLEHCPEDVTSRADSRYHRIEHDGEAIEKLLVEIFLESYSKPPRQITLDLDVTDDLVHGNQEEAFFNPYYGGYCYAPLYIFCGQHLLVAKLRASNVDPAEGALDELQRIIKLIRSRWGNVKILVRGDSAYSREDIMAWCESQMGVDYLCVWARAK